MNSLVATSLFYQPEQELSFKKIKQSVHMLYNYINDKQHKNFVSAPPQNYDIMIAALNLGFKVVGNPEDRKKGNDALVSMKD